MNFLEGMRHFGNRKLQGKEDNNMMNFAVVVVTYNRLELLKECLECIRNQELVPNNVVIVDNNSTDGTGKYLNGVKEIIEHRNIIYSDRKHHMLWVGIRYHLARWLRAGISDFLNPSIDKEISKYNLQLIIDAIHDGLVGHLGINKDYRP